MKRSDNIHIKISVKWISVCLNRYKSNINSIVLIELLKLIKLHILQCVVIDFICDHI